MKVLLAHEDDAPWQQLESDWYGTPVEPPFQFRCRLSDDAFIFSARRAAPALLHPDARPGQYQAQLWRYDTAEFFIAPPGGEPYFEFNLAPNGAWWAAAFSSPRVVNPTLSDLPPGITASGHAHEHGWACEARIPLSLLGRLGLFPHTTSCRLAVDAILGSPAPRYLTTAADLSGKPNFHRPWSWELTAPTPPQA